MWSKAEVKREVEAELAENGEMDVCRFLSRLGRLNMADIDDDARLVAQLYGSHLAIAREIAAATSHARHLGLKAQVRAPRCAVGTTAGLPDEGWAMTVWKREAAPQLDLFFDNPGTQHARDLVDAICQEDFDEAYCRLESLEASDPGHALVGTAPLLLELLSWDKSIDPDQWDRWSTAARLAQSALGDRGADVAARLWERYAARITPRAAPEADASAALCMAGKHAEAISILSAMDDPTAVHLHRAVQVSVALEDKDEAAGFLCRLCLHADVTDALVESLLGHRFFEAVADAWFEKDLDQHGWSAFPAFLALRRVLRTEPAGIECDKLNAALEFTRKPGDVDRRIALQRVAPELFDQR